MKDPQSSAHARSPAERRASERVDVSSSLVGYTDKGDEVQLLNLSETGMMVHFAEAIPPGDVRRYRFDYGNHSLLVTARAVHVLGIAREESHSYAVGLAFTEPLTGQQRAAVAFFTGG